MLRPSKALRASLPALEYLTVHQNRIESLPAFDLPEFTTLNVGGNPLKALPDLSRCPKLRVLIVDDCGLADAPASRDSVQAGRAICCVRVTSHGAL